MMNDRFEVCLKWELRQCQLNNSQLTLSLSIHTSLHELPDHGSLAAPPLNSKYSPELSLRLFRVEVQAHESHWSGYLLLNNFPESPEVSEQSEVGGGVLDRRISR